jgi:hypothetical protein
VNRHGPEHRQQLCEQGADVVVADLAELMTKHEAERQHK